MSPSIMGYSCHRIDINLGKLVLLGNCIKFAIKFRKPHCFKSKHFKQGRIHGYPSRVQVGRSSAGEGHLGIWAGAVASKISKTPKK